MKAHGLNPRIKKSPFFEKAVEYGATEFHPYNGMWMPVGYDSPVNEYWNVLERASLWDVGVQKCVEIAGPDAEAFMQLLTPRDITTIEPGRCATSSSPTRTAVCSTTRSCCESLKTGSGCRPLTPTCTSGPRASRRLRPRGRDHHPHVYPMQLQGPRSAEIMVDVFGEEILDLRYYWWMRSSVDGIDVVISRTGYSSELGYEVYLLGEARGGELWEILMTAGKPYGISPGSPNRIRRIEGGVLDYASDITPTRTHSNLVSIDSSHGTPISSQGRAREGARRRGSSTPDRPLPRRPCLAEEQRTPLARDERQHEGRFCHERRAFPRLDRNIAFAMIDVPFDANDTLLTVETVEEHAAPNARRCRSSHRHRRRPRSCADRRALGKMWQLH